MKKITLFLVAIFAMINVANAQRAWAYDLELTPSVDSYTFAFKAVTAGDATLVFYKEGAEAGTLNLGSVSAGDNTVTKTSEELLSAIGKAGDFTWGVKMSAGAIALASNGFTAEVTDDSRGIYDFYIPQGLAANNNPELDHFSKIYIAEPQYNTQTNGGTTRTQQQKPGIFVYDQTLTELNPKNDGYEPTNVTFHHNSRQEMHRVAVNPVNGHVAFAYNIEGSPAVWSVDPNNLEGEATNLIDGLGITKPNSICFDEDGVLYVMDNGNTSTGGTLVKIKNGALTKIVQNAIWGVEDNAIVSDGRGGIWIAQHRFAIDDYAVLSHVNENGEIDFKVTKASATALKNLFPTANGNASYRGQCAYYVKDDLLAFGGNGRGTIYEVTYNATTGAPSLSMVYRTPYIGTNIDGLAFDYAGDLYLMSASAERFYKYAIPTTNNTCTTPAKKSQVITLVSATPEYNVTISVNGNGTVAGANTGTYLEGTELTLTATPAEHHDFINWTGYITSTDNPLTITVNSDINITANFQEHTKYTITAVPNDENMGTVTGGGTYYAGATVTLTAVAKSTYYFVNWSDGNTNATRTFPASANLTLTANFAKANPRAWAYDLKMVEEGDNYKFSFTATTAANATLLFLDKEGNELYAARNIGAVAAGANTVSIEKAYFTQVKDVYWSVKMDGEAITAVAEITDQSRDIYDFYNMMGVVVDNDPNSEMFGDIYVQMSLGGTTNGKIQTPGLFLFNQDLDVLNDNPNVGIQPALPAGYTLTGNRNKFHRLNINPLTGDLVYCYNIADQPAVFAIGRNNMTGEVTNLLSGVTGLYRSGAHCFDENGTLYVIDIYPYSNTQYSGGWNSMGIIYKIIDGIATELVRSNKFANESITMTADGRSGIWIAQNRGNGIDTYYQLAHITDEGIIDWAVNKDTPQGFTGSSSRGALAYDSERQILAQGRNGKVELYTVSYEPTITVTPLHTIADDNIGNNIDGLAFDFAGDLYVVNSSKEKFQKFTLPTADNICTVPAPKSQTIIKEVRHTVTTNIIGNGTVIGAGEYVEGETATLTASPAAHHQFVNWTLEDATTSTDNPLEFVVNSDITVTAHFEPIQYTMVALTNDENKGTVSGAGAYNYGTEVMLTATPKPGYKLLYWSDRSTENPRNITMTKNEAISAYFVKIYDEEPTFTITKLWENLDAPASTNNGYQAVGWDGKIYLKDRGNDVINVYSDATTSATYASTDSKDDQSIAVDDAGNLVLRSGSTNFYDAPKQVILYKKGETTYKTIDFTLPVSGRCDFISASGDLFSAKGGYVYFYCQYQTTVSRLHVKNGGATAGDIVIDAVGAGITGGNSQSHVMVDIFGNLVTHSRTAAINKTINAYTGEATTFTLPNDQKAIALGGCSFELGGKEFWAYNVTGSNICNTEWKLYNMTDKKYLSNEILYVENNTDKNSAANWLNVQVVDENTAYIYQFCPTVAMAVWKVSLVRNDLENFTITATANNALMGSIVGSGEYYEGGTAMLTANAYPGFRFVNWTKEGVEVSTDATYLFTVTEDVELVANFEVILLDTENNEGILTKLNDQTVDVAVYRSLTAGMYNTLCLPFDVDNFSGTPLENTTVWQYNGAEVKGEGDSKEIFLEFTEVISLEAGQPYLVEPAAEIEAPMVFNGVTISAINGSEVAQSAVTMHGILHPTELEANNKSILFLVENNNLAWANETANMNGMRAYFKVNEPSLLSARTRAYIRREPTVATDMENITTSETEIKKVIYNGSLYIIRGDEVYTIQGTKVK